jgi:hypothetical protein
MSEIKIIGLSAPAGFSINDYLREHPANKETIERVKKQVVKHINSCYKKGVEPNYSDWYAGVTDKSHNRYNAHKRDRNIDDLPFYKKFYVFSMSNARNLESSLCKKFGMGNKDISGGIYINSKYLYVFNQKMAKKNGLI